VVGACQAQVKFFVDSVLRHKNKASKMIYSSLNFIVQRTGVKVRANTLQRVD